jgi:hypothetical protein
MTFCLFVIFSVLAFFLTVLPFVCVLLSPSFLPFVISTANQIAARRYYHLSCWVMFDVRCGAMMNDEARMKTSYKRRTSNLTAASAKINTC